jgi:hypothetical protein
MSENLIPFNELTEEEHRKIAQKGGKASVKARREKKLMKQTLETLLQMTLNGKEAADLDEIKSLDDLKGKNITVSEAMMLVQVKHALSGDLAAASFIRDMVGEKPAEKLSVSAQVNNPFADLTTEELRKLVDSDG